MLKIKAKQELIQQIFDSYNFIRDCTALFFYWILFSISSQLPSHLLCVTYDHTAFPPQISLQFFEIRYMCFERQEGIICSQFTSCSLYISCRLSVVLVLAPNLSSSFPDCLACTKGIYQEVSQETVVDGPLCIILNRGQYTILLNQLLLSAQRQLIYISEFVGMDHSVKLIKLQLATFFLKSYTITSSGNKKISCVWMGAVMESSIVV